MQTRKHIREFSLDQKWHFSKSCILVLSFQKLQIKGFVLKLPQKIFVSGNDPKKLPKKFSGKCFLSLLFLSIEGISIGTFVKKRSFPASKNLEGSDVFLFSAKNLGSNFSMFPIIFFFSSSFFFEESESKA